MPRYSGHFYYMTEIADRLSLSTCWCSSRHSDGYEMVKEMTDLGFRRIELSHGIRMSLVPGILQAVEEGWLKYPLYIIFALFQQVHSMPRRIFSSQLQILGSKHSGIDILCKLFCLLKS